MRIWININVYNKIQKKKKINNIPKAGVIDMEKQELTETPESFNTAFWKEFLSEMTEEKARNTLVELYGIMEESKKL